MKKIFGAVVLVLFTTFINQYGSYLKESREAKIQLIKMTKQKKIDNIEKQLLEFYIPLDIQIDRSKRLYLNFREKYKNTKIDKTTSENYKLQWRIYLMSVFQIVHVRMEDLIISKRYLAEYNEELSVQLNILEQHIAEYKVIFTKWGKGDTKTKIDPIRFPSKLGNLIKNDIKYLELKKKDLEK